MALIDKLNAIGDAIRAKTGKTDKLTLDQMPLEIESITGGGATVEDIIPEQELTFALDESSGAYMLQGYNLFNITSMTVGTKYKVLWGEREDECTAIEVSFYGYPMIAIGNPVMIGGENNNLPFAIGYITIPDDGDSQYSCIIASLDGSATKNVRVYQEASGGVQDDRVKYVTFIGLNGAELYRQPVIVGDTCHNPVDKNYIETPTKESTVQYTYTYSGWSLTEGGSASSSALANVTEDRTVYVAFKEEVRKYTITFYDSDDTTVLTTQTLAYGSTPSYAPEKGGYTFTGWTPELTAVVGDASYTANWIEQVEFASAPWSYISELSESGQAEQVFNIGDKKAFEFTYDGTTYSVNAEIIAFNHDDKADGSGKVGITLCTDVSTSVIYRTNNSTKTYNGKTGYYSGGYGNCDMRTSLNGAIFNTLPEEMKSAIKSVSKDWFIPNDKVLKTTSEKLWLFSCSEICACKESDLKATDRSNYAFVTEGTRYTGFSLARPTSDGTAFEKDSAVGILLRSALQHKTNPNYNILDYRYKYFYHSGYGGYIVGQGGDGHLLFGFCI